MYEKLKVKIKSLATEAQIIRHEERSVLKQARWIQKHTNVSVAGSAEGLLFNELRTHRVVDVRREARAAQLAYAYLRGRPYTSVEHKMSKVPPWEKVIRIVKSFDKGMAERASLKSWASENFLTSCELERGYQNVLDRV